MSFDRKKVAKLLRAAGADGIKMSEVAQRLKVARKDQPSLRRLVQAMIQEGVVEKRGRYGYALAGDQKPAKPKRSTRRSRAAAEVDLDSQSDGPFATGRIRVHPAGFGFVLRDDGGVDIFVPAKYRGTALDGDRVRLYTWEGYKGTEGRVEEVLSRGRAKLTGTICSAGRTRYLEPDDPRIVSRYGHVVLEGSGAGRVGDCVLAEITRYPTEAQPEIAVRAVRVLGLPEDPRTEVAKIVACGDIPDEFPRDALAQAERIPQSLRPEDFADRIDLRDRPFITIDPEDARDFDDAICLEADARGGHRVWVAVADVSHYVGVGDAFDREAQIRGVSVYFPDRVIPMLPPEMSAGICSLNPDVDRCAMVVRLDLDAEGVVRTSRFAAAVIRSHARLDYPGVAAALAGDFRGRRAAYRPWAASLRAMDELARKLRARRMEEGALELHIPEARVVMDDDDPLLVRDVVRSKGHEEVKRAYELVEEYMLLANESVAEFFAERDLPTMWRCHAAPEPARIAELADVLESFGVTVQVDELESPKGVQALLGQLRGHPGERSLSLLVLRSLSQAVYSPENVGHFGLASPRYVHFTSPIRRYPDLLVHRLLKIHLHREGEASGGATGWKSPTASELTELAGQCSANERRAAEAERDVVDMYRTYLMRDRLGERFFGSINAITSFGVFVELDEPFVEGMVSHDSMADEPLDFDEGTMMLIGRRSGIRFRLGDRIEVEVLAISVSRRRIELRRVRAEVVEPKPSRRARTGTKAKRAASGSRANSATSGKTRKSAGRAGRARRR